MKKKIKKIIVVLLCISLLYADVNMVSFADVISTLSTPIVDDEDNYAMEETLEEIIDDGYLDEPLSDDDVEEINDIASESEIEELDENVEEIIENENDVNNDIAEEASESEITEIDIVMESEVDVDLATKSEIDFLSDKKEIFVSTISQTLLSRISDMTFYDQLRFYGEDLVSYNDTDNMIILNNDVEIDDTLYIKEDDINLDLNSHSITITTNSEALFIYNSTFSLYDNSVDIETDEENDERKIIDYIDLENKYGKIKSNVYKNTIIKTYDSNINLYGGIIRQDEGAETIYAENTNILIDGAIIYGGKGKDETNIDGEIGHQAILFKTDNSNTIYAKNGYIKGGNGGKGVGKKVAKGGFGTKINNTKIINKNWYGPFNGKIGCDYGGGNGGIGIDIISNDRKVFSIDYCHVVGGDGGLGLKKTFKLFKAGSDLPKSYDLRKYKGINNDEPERNVVTSIKNQASAGICWDFSAVAGAESSLLRNDPEYAETLIAATESELDLSEIQFAYYYRNIPEDPLNNAGNAYSTGELLGGANDWQTDRYFSARKGLGLGRDYKNKQKIKEYCEGKDVVAQGYVLSTREKIPDEGGCLFANFSSPYSLSNLKTAINDELSSGDANKYDYKAILKQSGRKEKFEFDSQNDFIDSLKKEVYNHGATTFFVNNFYKDKSITYTDSSGIYTTYSNDNVSLGSGHAILVIGWDDNFPKDKFVIQPNNNGALLIKNSWGESSGYAWLSYEYAFEDGTSYIWRDWGKANERERLYYYDSGLTVDSQLVYKEEVIGNVFKMQKEEKLKSVTYYSFDNFKGDIKICKINSNNISDLSYDTIHKNENILYSKNGQNFITGYNDIPIDKEIIVDKDTYLYVYIENGDNGEDKDYPYFWNPFCYDDAENGFSPTENVSYFIDYDKNVNDMYYDTDSSNFTIRLLTECLSRYTIMYDANGVNVTTPSSVIKETGKSLLLDNPTNIPSGYYFDGWYTDNTFSIPFDGTSDFPGVNEGDTVTIYAKWKVDVNFDSNGHGTSPIATKAVLNKEIILPNITDVVTGYTLNTNYTWYEDSDCSNTSFVGKINDSYIVTKPITLYARWMENHYNVKLNPNGKATVNTEVTTSYAYEEKVDLANPFISNRYEFLYWNTQPDGSGDIYYGYPSTFSASYSKLKSNDGDEIVLYAIWSYGKYKIQYDGNGATSGSMDEKQMMCDISMPLATNSYIKTGYNFIGWATSSTTNAVYNDKQWVINLLDANKNETKILYAKWTPIHYTLKLNPNPSGQTGIASTSEISTVYEYDEDIILNNPGFTSTTHTFGGWTKNADGTGLSYAEGRAIKNLSSIDNSEVTLYAKWVPGSYKIIFDKNDVDAQGSMDYQTIEVDKSAKLNGNLYTKAGYHFIGWATSPASDVMYSDKALYSNLMAKKDQTYTLYAKWTANQYTIKYNANGGSISKSQETKIYDMNIKLASPSKIGHTFVGWYTDNDTFNNSYNGTTDLSNLQNTIVNIYAKWNPNIYNVTLNTAGGTINKGSVTAYTYGVGVTLPIDVTPAPPATTSFAGWYENNLFTGNKVSQITKTDIGDKVYFAKYAVKHIIIFNANGGTGTMANQDAFEGESTKLNNNCFSRSGYNFSGWKTQNGISYDNGATINNLTENITLYAQWNYINNDSGNLDNYNGGGGSSSSIGPISNNQNQQKENVLNNSVNISNKESVDYNTNKVNNKVNAMSDENKTIINDAISKIFSNKDTSMLSNSESKQQATNIAVSVLSDYVSIIDANPLLSTSKGLLTSYYANQIIDNATKIMKVAETKEVSMKEAEISTTFLTNMSISKPDLKNLTIDEVGMIIDKISSNMGPSDNQKMLSMVAVTQNDIKLNKDDKNMLYVVNKYTNIPYTGFIKINVDGIDNTYYLSNSGMIIVGTLKDVAGNVYLLGHDGTIQKGNVSINEKMFYTDANGKVVDADSVMIDVDLQNLVENDIAYTIENNRKTTFR